MIRQHSQSMEPLPTGESAVLRPLRNIEAVMLDVYGTFLVSASGDIGMSDADSHADAFRRAVSETGLTLLTDGARGAAYLRRAVEASHGRSREAGVDYPEVDIVAVWRETLESLQQEGHLAGFHEETDVPTLSLCYELLTNPVWPVPGAAESLTELTVRGIHLGLISNAQWFTPLLFPALLGGELDALGIRSDMQFWSWQTGRAKPSEHLFRQAADALRGRGIEPDRVLYVGNDMLNDVLPASATGFRTALFAGDRRSLRRREGDPRVGTLAPDIVLLNLRDLLTCIRPGPEA